MAEVVGEPTPCGFHYVPNRADGEAKAGLDALQTDVIPHLECPNGVLALDETGFVKKRDHAAAVARQYTGTIGTVEHCPRGVFVGYPMLPGQTLLDRERY